MVVSTASIFPKNGVAPVSDSNVIKLTQPVALTDSLTEVSTQRARALLTQAVEAEMLSFSQNMPVSSSRVPACEYLIDYFLTIVKR